MDLGLKGKIALVTGAGSQVGMGKAIALTLAGEGCDVIVTDIDSEGAKQTADAVEKLGQKALAVKTDITKSTEVSEMVKAAIKQFGQIDILVNNAGAVAPPKFFVDKTEADCDLELNLNLKGALNCTRAVLPDMIAHKGGKIINITSFGAERSIPTTTIYGAAKAGVVRFTKVLAVEVASFGINVNSVSPGTVSTNFGRGYAPPGKAEDVVPLKRTQSPQDIANMVAILASDVTRNITGQNIGVDGGMSL